MGLDHISGYTQNGLTRDGQECESTEESVVVQGEPPGDSIRRFTVIFLVVNRKKRIGPVSATNVHLKSSYKGSLVDIIFEG